MEIGPRDMVKSECVIVGRVDRNQKVTVARGELGVKVQEMLDQIHSQLFTK